MINPDGVVAGNYRTSFIGKDLNRLFQPDDPTDAKYSKIDDLLKPEIQSIQNLITNARKETVKGILAFIDVYIIAPLEGLSELTTQGVNVKYVVCCVGSLKLIKHDETLKAGR